MAMVMVTITVVKVQVNIPTLAESDMVKSTIVDGINTALKTFFFFSQAMYANLYAGRVSNSRRGGDIRVGVWLVSFL
jgi:hypothetical protein